MMHRQLSKPKGIILASLLLLLVFVIACGAAAPQEPAAEPQAAPQQEPVSQPEAAAQREPATEPQAAPQQDPVAEPQAVEAVPTAPPEAVAVPEIADLEVHPGTLTILTGNFGNERMERAIGSGGSTHIGRIFGGFLSDTNRDNEMLPGIATDWRFSADGLTLTYTIREGVKFHDGSDLTTEDVWWTLAHTMGPDTEAAGTPLRGAPLRFAQSMAAVEMTAPDEVSLTGKFPLPQLPLELSRAGDGWFHMLPKRDKLWDEEEAAAYDRNPIAAGRMMRVDYTPGAKMVFERFDDYFHQPAYGFDEDQRMKFQTLEMHVVPEEATMVIALETGDADIIPIGLDARKQVEAAGGRYVFARGGTALVGWLFGCDRPRPNGSYFPCRDQRVRQALDYAMPKELMRDTLWGPDVYEIRGWYDVVPGTMAYSPDLDPRPFDPDKARQLLTEAGYPDGQGFEPPIIINTRPAAAAPLLIESAQLIADTWRRELGIPVEVKVGEHAAIAQKRLNLELEGEIWWRESGVVVDNTDTLQARWGDPESSWRAHDNPELFARVQEVIRIVDTRERITAIKPLLLDLKEETHYLLPGYLNIPFAVGPRVESWEPYPIKDHFSALHTLVLK